jgi:glycosyltransferase involved in cell wall biosynthesis
MALGTPVIASTVAGIPELLDQGRCGELVPPRDVKTLADAIEKLLSNEPLRRSFAESGRRYGEQQFDLWKIGQQVASILNSTKRVERK